MLCRSLNAVGIHRVCRNESLLSNHSDPGKTSFLSTTRSSPVIPSLLLLFTMFYLTCIDIAILRRENHFKNLVHVLEGGTFYCSWLQLFFGNKEQIFTYFIVKKENQKRHQKWFSIHALFIFFNKCIVQLFLETNLNEFVSLYKKKRKEYSNWF